MVDTAFALEVDACVTDFGERSPAECASWSGFEPCVCACDRSDLAAFEVCAGTCLRTHCPYDGGP